MFNRKYWFSLKSAKDLIKQQKYRQARHFIHEELSEINKNESLLSRSNLLNNLKLLNDLTICEYKLKNWEESERTLEQSISLVDRNLNPNNFKNFNDPLLFKTYEKYMSFLLKNNLTKAVKEGEAWIKDICDPIFISKLNFYLGTVEILRENIFDAKDYLYQILTSKLPLLLLGMAFNNLGVACWWDRFPNYSSLVADEEFNEEEEYTERIYKSKVSDFSFAIDFFQTAVYKFELFYEVSKITGFNSEMIFDLETTDINNISSNRLKIILDMTNKDTFNVSDFLKISNLSKTRELYKNPLSIIPLFNLAEMLISTYEKEDQKNLGISYLYICLELLKDIVEKKKNFKYESNTVLSEIINEYFSTFKSLYIRTLTILSMIEELKPVI